MAAPSKTAGGNTKANGADEPGALKGTTTITLHTRQARRLFKGRRKGEYYKNGDPKPPIPGVYAFSNLAKQLQTGSMHGDPYADWYFVRIDTEFEDVESFYDELEHRLDTLLDGTGGFDVALHMSRKPSTEEVSFFSPYSFKACHIVLQADRILTKLLGANHYALVKRGETEKLQDEVFARVRRLFAIPAKYRFTGTTRTDFLPDVNARGQRAVDAYGAVPSAILEKAVEPAYGYWRSHDGKPGADQESDGQDPSDDAIEQPGAIEKSEDAVIAAE